MHHQINISSRSVRRLREQGYRSCTVGELSQYRFGIRFAYAVCFSLVLTGLIIKSQALLLIAGVIAFFGMFPPYHPLDYVYNYVIRHFIGRPKLPHRPNQGRFACRIAAPTLAVINYFVYVGNFTIAYIFGAFLLISAFLVGFLDLCIPSKIYNALFERDNINENTEQKTAELKSLNNVH